MVSTYGRQIRLQGDALKVKVVKSLQEDGEFEYKIKVRRWFIWSIEFRSTDPEEVRVIYNRMLSSPNMERA